MFMGPPGSECGMARQVCLRRWTLADRSVYYQPHGLPPRRDRILDTAFRLFYAHGIRAVGVDRIIAESGVAKATFYKWFPAKDDLVLAYLDRVDGVWSGQLHEAAAAAGPEPADQLVGLFDALGTACRRDGYRGCAFINAAAEAAPGTPVHDRTVAHKAAVLDVGRPASPADAGARRPAWPGPLAHPPARRWPGQRRARRRPGGRGPRGRVGPGARRRRRRPGGRVSTVGLVLAAGAGRRMGGPKALVRLTDGGPTLVETAVARVLEGGCDRVVVVVGAAAEQAAALVAGTGAEVVLADDWDEGMGASLRAGLAPPRARRRRRRPGHPRRPARRHRRRHGASPRRRRW